MFKSLFTVLAKTVYDIAMETIEKIANKFFDGLIASNGIIVALEGPDEDEEKVQEFSPCICKCTQEVFMAKSKKNAATKAWATRKGLAAKRSAAARKAWVTRRAATNKASATKATKRSAAAKKAWVTRKKG